MRFLMLNWRDPLNPKSGGAERVSQAFLAALKERGHEVFWFANAYPGCRPCDRVDGVQVVRGGGIGSSVRQAIRWYRQQPRFDLVIDQHHGIPWFAPWWCRTQCVAYIHEVLGPIWHSFYKWPTSSIGEFQEVWTHRLYRKVPFWTPSESTRKALEAEGVRSVTVLPNGVDTRPIGTLEPKPLTQPLRLIVVCRLAPNKRVDHALSAVKALARRGSDVHLTIVGNGDIEADLHQQARAPELQGRVRFAGRLPEDAKNAELQRAHLLLHTSVREGWGLNVIEANAMGTPAVVYPVGGLIDSTVDGETGVVTPAEAPEAMADAVLALANDPARYERLRRQAWERSKQFQWDKVLPLVSDWLESQAKVGTR